MQVPTTAQHTDAIIPLGSEAVLDAYFRSLLSYFNRLVPPSGALLKLKFEELLVNILSTNRHGHLKYFISGLCQSTRPFLQQVMEENFTKNLSLKEFARLCGRSLSSFKVDFRTTFLTTPGKWLLEKRLEYGHYLLKTTGGRVDEIGYKAGFENRTHFIRVFKKKYGLTPGQFKMERNPTDQ